VDILKRLKPHLDFSVHADRALWAILCVGVFTLARIGELVPSKTAKLKVTIGSLTITNNHGALSLRGTKTDLDNKGVTLYFFKNNSTCCPFTAMNVYLTGLLVKDPKSTLFTDRDGKRLTQAWVIKRLRQLLQIIGLDGNSLVE